LLESEVAVIGGGIIGTSIAYFLAKEGKKVILLERGHLACEASGACDGLIMLQTKSPGVQLDLAIKSVKMYNELAEELDHPIEYQRKGGMIVIERDEELETMRRFVHSRRQAGLDIDILKSEEARKLEPALSSHIAGATYCSSEGQVNPIYMTFAFAMAAKKFGAKIHTGTEVLSIGMDDGRIRSVSTNLSEVKTNLVVNAAGAYAPFVGLMAGMTIPIKPRRGQLVVTERSPPLIKRGLLDAKYILSKSSSDIPNAGVDTIDRLSGGLALEQTATGNVIIGSTREFVGYNKATTLDGITAIVKHSTRIVPGLKRLCAIRAFAGLRPYTPDKLPVIDLLDYPEGFVIAAGHEGDGIALAPVTGKIVAESILTGRVDPSLQALSLNRFEKGDR
jgi:sarcosine oxidase subunit beta